MMMVTFVYVSQQIIHKPSFEHMTTKNPQGISRSVTFESNNQLNFHLNF